MQLLRTAMFRARRPHSRGRPSSSPSPLAQIRDVLAGDRTKFGLLAAFMLVVALTGGASRSDVLSLPILRPASVLFCLGGLLYLTGERARAARGPLLVVLAMMLLAVLQLVPLPPAIWTALPNHEFVAESDRLLGIEGAYRPLSLDPNRTWNALFALFVPLAAVVLVAVQGPQYRRATVQAVLGVGLLSAVIGMLQAIGLVDHFYAITHDRYPVGLFANKNHQSVLLSGTMLAGCWLAATSDIRKHAPGVVIGTAFALILALFPLIILTGSRAGLALSGPALLACCWMIFKAPATEILLKRAGTRKWLFAGGGFLVLATPLLFVLTVLLGSTRDTALSRLFTEDSADDLRWSFLPISLEMTRDFFPFGAGLGAFERTFMVYETADVLSLRYANQAHNDVIQIVLEGGLLGAIIVLAALVWAGRLLWRQWRRGNAVARITAVFLAGAIALWLAASIVDYPLRTPLAAMVLAALTTHLSLLSTRPRSDPGTLSRDGGQGEAP